MLKILLALFYFPKPTEDSLDTDTMKDHLSVNITKPLFFAALIYTVHSYSLLLLCLISFSFFPSPNHSFTQFSPLYHCPSSNISYYSPYTSHSSHLCVLILTSLLIFLSSLPFFFISSPPTVIFQTFLFYPTPSQSALDDY